MFIEDERINDKIELLAIKLSKEINYEACYQITKRHIEALLQEQQNAIADWLKDRNTDYIDPCCQNNVNFMAEYIRNERNND